MSLWVTSRVTTYGGQANTGSWLSAKPWTAQVHLTRSPVGLQPCGLVTFPVPECIIGIDIPRIWQDSQIDSLIHGVVQFSSVQSRPTLCDRMDRSTSGLPAHHQLPEFTQSHVHWVGDAIQPSYPLSSLSPPTFNLSQHQGLFQWVSSSHQVVKVLEFQLQHQSFQWIFRTDCL